MKRFSLRPDLPHNPHDNTEGILRNNRRLDAIAALINGRETVTAITFEPHVQTEAGTCVAVTNNSGRSPHLIDKYSSFLTMCTNTNISDMLLSNIDSAYTSDNSSLQNTSSMENMREIKYIFQPQFAREVQKLLQASYDEMNHRRDMERARLRIADYALNDQWAAANQEIQQAQVDFPNMGIFNDCQREYEKSNKQFFKIAKDMIGRTLHFEDSKNLEEDKMPLATDIIQVALSLARDAPDEISIDHNIKTTLQNTGLTFIQYQSTPQTQGIPHAEMQLLDHAQSKDIMYIGISKLCCIDCQATINVLAKHGIISQDRIVRGTHLKSFKGWKQPNILTGELYHEYVAEKALLKEASPGYKEEQKIKCRSPVVHHSIHRLLYPPEHATTSTTISPTGTTPSATTTTSTYTTRSREPLDEEERRRKKPSKEIEKEYIAKEMAREKRIYAKLKQEMQGTTLYTADLKKGKEYAKDRQKKEMKILSKIHEQEKRAQRAQIERAQIERAQIKRAQIERERMERTETMATLLSSSSSHSPHSHTPPPSKRRKTSQDRTP